MKIEDFKIETDKDGNLKVSYIGNDPKIDKCSCLLSPKFANYHLVKLLLKL